MTVRDNINAEAIPMIHTTTSPTKIARVPQGGDAQGIELVNIGAAALRQMIRRCQETTTISSYHRHGMWYR